MWGHYKNISHSAPSSDSPSRKTYLLVLAVVPAGTRLCTVLCRTIIMHVSLQYELRVPQAQAVLRVRQYSTSWNQELHASSNLFRVTAISSNI